MALRKYPPRGPGMGQRQLTLEDDGEPTLVQFLESACEDAWYGRKPALAGLTGDLLTGDASRFARAPLRPQSVNQGAHLMA